MQSQCNEAGTGPSFLFLSAIWLLHFEQFKVKIEIYISPQGSLLKNNDPYGFVV